MLDSPGRLPQLSVVETSVWKIAAKDPDPEVIGRAAALIQQGRLVAFPTETVYGLGANALDADAVRRIFEAKQRPAHNPLIVHLLTRAGLDQVVGHWPDEAELLARYFWPGPLSLVVRKKASVPGEVSAGANTVGVRVPDHPVALALLAKADCPIAAPSANPSNAISPTTARHVLQGLNGRIDAVLDAGPCKGGIESTVLSLVRKEPIILRPGLIDRVMLEAVLGRKVYEPSQLQFEEGLDAEMDIERPMESPGQSPRHYAPSTPMELVEGSGWLRVERLLEAGNSVGWLTFGMAAAQDKAHPRLTSYAMPADPKGYAMRLYAALHDLDGQKLDRIVCAAPPDRDVWAAVRDRLHRAAAK